MLEKFSSPIVKASPNKDIEAESEWVDKSWTHRAYLLVGAQALQISYFDEYHRGLDDLGASIATLYVFNNNETVLYDSGSAEMKTTAWDRDTWKFSKLRAEKLELVKLDNGWMEAVKEIASELERVKTLNSKELYSARELKAEKKKSNFDLGDFD